MQQRQFRFALFGSTYQPKSSVAVGEFLACVARHGGKVSIEREYHRYLSLGSRLALNNAEVFDADSPDADFVVSIGGDGTLLRAANCVGASRLPIIGVNTGRLGFLADTTAAEIENTVEAIFNGDFDIEEHAVIEATTTKRRIKGSPFALNDIAVLKLDNASMISVTATINGEFLTTYQADGLIISTPTGSTAYSLSNGGPVMAPMSGVLCLTPVAPHSLNVRPMVIPDNAEIGLTVKSRSHKFLIAIDGRSEKCAESVSLTIRRAQHNIRIIRLKGRDYYSTLRGKMMWGKVVR
ncbi:MAG: NAD kinase [Prevotella sp.]|uniref:NAD kinase n=1 Tax=Prevotella sp. TaxID=59823 RepID=UPI002A2B026F|nr:NAD kinase [Prevotella sp.]MDD7317740.1 NAD kinase [Prevotellaceae bacterium]MDY4020655.1 NAD kinase [Prevotella sp.]